MRPTSVSIALLAALLLVPSGASMSVDAELHAAALSTNASSTTTSTLTALLLDDPANPPALADASFTMEARRAVVANHHASVYASGVTVPDGYEPLHDGPAQVFGREVRPGFHLWVLPLDAETPPKVHVESPTNTTIEPSGRSHEERSSETDTNLPAYRIPTDTAMRWTGGERTTATVTGDFRIVLWELDVDLVTDDSTQHRSTGAKDPTGEPGLAGSADELFIEAHDATLTIPLAPSTYWLYLADARLAASSLTLHDAQGTLAGIPLANSDAHLAGELTARLAATGADAPLSASIVGDMHAFNGQTLTTTTPTNSAEATWIALAAALVILAALSTGGALYIAQVLSGRLRKTGANPHDAPARSEQQRHTKHRSVEKEPDREAERIVLRVVQRCPGIGVRDLLARSGMRAVRARAALGRLMERGSVERRGRGARWHLFAASPDLETTWRWKAALACKELRLLHGVLREHKGVEQSLVVAWCRERWGWNPSTTRRRLHHLADVGLALASKSVSRETVLTTWDAATPTEGS